MKLCKDCQHYLAESPNAHKHVCTALCLLDPVIGGPDLTQVRCCYQERTVVVDGEDRCGWTGKHFIPKTPTP